jgi:hypothetical protein
MLSRVSMGSRSKCSPFIWLAAVAFPLVAQFPPSEASEAPNTKLGINLVGAAEIIGSRLRLTPAIREQSGAAWFSEKQRISAGFEMKFQFQLTAQGGLGRGADGFAFVLQNEGINALAGRGSAGGFATGDGHGDFSAPGIPRSIAVFFDTYRNGDGGDPSDNYVALCTNGPISNMRWPPRRLAIARKLRIRLKDGRAHLARIVYEPPLMSLYIDDGPAEFRAPVDLLTVVDNSGAAFVGFTASTGNGFQNHDILAYSLTFPKPAVSSDISVVQSELHFLPDNCLADRNLCTPREAIIDQKSPSVFDIILPAHLAWSASIPNALGRQLEVLEPRGRVCFEVSGGDVDECSGPEGLDASKFSGKRDSFLSSENMPGALIAETRGGRTRFSVNIRKGKASKNNQGFFEFTVRLK